MILKKDILIEGHPTLRKIAVPVTLPLSDGARKTLYDMLEHVKNSQDEIFSKKYDVQPAVGIAAPQIGVSQRMFAMHTTDDDGILHSHMFINPTITSFSLEKVFLPSGEGCLSVVDKKEGVVPRYKKIKFSAYELFSNGNVLPVSYEFSDFIAVVFQHEYDHLDGILFVDKLTTKADKSLIPLF